MWKNNISLLCLLFAVSGAMALPQYAARSARICSNCHSDPYKNNYQESWENPKLSERKCNMSCQGCHINPAGGGIRNAPGRYYAKSTLPTFGAVDRPRADKENLDINEVLRFFNVLKKGKQKKYSEVKPDVQPVGTFFYPADWLSFGAPLGTSKEQSQYAYDHDRFGQLNADPLLTLGADVRSAWWNAEGANFVFPMQFEVGAALHPVEHITFSGTAAAQGKTKGPTAASKEPMKMQNAFVLLHELPMTAYLQAGWFLPEFGIRVDDHTLFNRKYFEMDPSQKQNTVRGVQMGMAPNYPYASAAFFETRDEEDHYNGYGYTGNLYWRDLKWGMGTSYMSKIRDYEEGGNLSSVSFNGYLNLWTFLPFARYRMPITWQFEYIIAQRDRTSVHSKWMQSAYSEVNYLLTNGLNLRVNYSSYDDDFELEGDYVQRFGSGMDWTVYRGIRMTNELRVTLPEGGKPSRDIIFFVHWYL